MQCAGSRDQNHLNYCSYICCMATLKQCLYIAEQNPDTQITVYYIDLRAPGRYVKVLEKVKALPNVKFVKGKVADAVQAEGNRVRITAEDAVRGEKMTLDYDLVVLATGMQPWLAKMRPCPCRWTKTALSRAEKRPAFSPLVARACPLM